MNHCVLCQSDQIQIILKKRGWKFGDRDYFKCSNCALIFADSKTLFSVNEERKIYDQHENHIGNVGYVEFLSQLIVPLKKYLKRNCKVLDYGCGPGPTLSCMFEKEGVIAHLFDPIYFPDEDVLKQDYEIVTATEVAEHFYHPGREFLRLKNLIKKKSGVIGIMTQLYDVEDSFEGWYYHRDPTHVAFYSRETFEWIAKYLGMRVRFFDGNVILLDMKSMP